MPKHLRPPQRLHELLLAARLKRNLSQRQLYGLCGVLHPVISRIEQGRVTQPQFWVVARIAKALDLSLDDLAQCEMPAPSEARRRLRSRVARKTWRENRDTIVAQMSANRKRQIKRSTPEERSEQAKRSWATRRQNEAANL